MYHSALQPHPVGTYVRILHGRRPGHKYPIHELVHLGGGATCLSCRYCCSYWKRGTWHGRDYRLDMRTGWWEDDDGACFCIHFDARRHVVEPEMFVVCKKTTLSVEQCDYATDDGVRDDRDFWNPWGSVLVVNAFDGLKRIDIARWKGRLLEKNSDCLGKFLVMVKWTRLRRTCASMQEQFLILARKQHQQHLKDNRAELRKAMMAAKKVTSEGTISDASPPSRLQPQSPSPHANDGSGNSFAPLESAQAPWKTRPATFGFAALEAAAVPWKCSSGVSRGVEVQQRSVEIRSCPTLPDQSRATDEDICLSLS